MSKYLTIKLEDNLGDIPITISATVYRERPHPNAQMHYTITDKTVINADTQEEISLSSEETEKVDNLILENARSLT